MILDDDEYERLFPGLSGNPAPHALWSIMCASISMYLSQHSGLPVDFQIQQMTEANDKFNGPRSALGFFLHYQSGRPDASFTA